MEQGTGRIRAYYAGIFMEDHVRDGPLAPKILATQLKQLKALGVQTIDCNAARGSGMIGYKAWPKMGFDGPLKGKHKENLPEEFARAETIQSFYAMPGGRAAWEKYGDSINLSLDLAKADKTFAIIDKLLARARGRRSKAKPSP